MSFEGCGHHRGLCGFLLRGGGEGHISSSSSQVFDHRKLLRLWERGGQEAVLPLLLTHVLPGFCWSMRSDPLGSLSSQAFKIDILRVTDTHSCFLGPVCAWKADWEYLHSRFLFSTEASLSWTFIFGDIWFWPVLFVHQVFCVYCECECFGFAMLFNNLKWNISPLSPKQRVCFYMISTENVFSLLKRFMAECELWSNSVSFWIVAPLFLQLCVFCPFVAWNAIHTENPLPSLWFCCCRLELLLWLYFWIILDYYGHLRSGCSVDALKPLQALQGFMPCLLFQIRLIRSVHWCLKLQAVTLRIRATET